MKLIAVFLLAAFLASLFVIGFYVRSNSVSYSPGEGYGSSLGDEEVGEGEGEGYDCKCPWPKNTDDVKVNKLEDCLVLGKDLCPLSTCKIEVRYFGGISPLYQDSLEGVGWSTYGNSYGCGLYWFWGWTNRCQKYVHKCEFKKLG